MIRWCWLLVFLIACGSPAVSRGFDLESAPVPVEPAPEMVEPIEAPDAEPPPAEVDAGQPATDAGHVDPIEAGGDASKPDAAPVADAAPACVPTPPPAVTPIYNPTCQLYPDGCGGSWPYDGVGVYTNRSIHFVTYGGTSTYAQCTALAGAAGFTVAITSGCTLPIGCSFLSGSEWCCPTFPANYMGH